ncbi:hypothetical protein V5O48_015650 [Marasmius crinis-equi]|uniref:Uncharacterized protein n=1 Tax=Marasmius crinis-equi TaxID=585013 RepID=A0ABR3ETX8_9AGAR
MNPPTPASSSNTVPLGMSYKWSTSLGIHARLSFGQEYAFKTAKLPFQTLVATNQDVRDPNAKTVFLYFEAEVKFQETYQIAENGFCSILP